MYNYKNRTSKCDGLPMITASPQKHSQDLMTHVYVIAMYYLTIYYIKEIGMVL
uniref:Uncharacterized protein n=1 Tax=Anguilla anguilla TaxID=7936 RepID=A0A0E9S4S2_ANGAN